MIRLATLTLIALILTSPLARAASSENVSMQQLAAANKLGSAVWLESGTTPVLGLYYDPAPTTRLGAVVLLHGEGQHPDWPDVIAPLRRHLGEHGWATLSLQMPDLPKPPMLLDERYRGQQTEADNRLSAALTHLNAQKISTIVVLGYGFGATQGYQYLARTPTQLAPLIKGIVSIGLTTPAKLPADMLPYSYLEQGKLPTLDIISTRQDPRAATLRQQAAQRAGNKGYRLMAVQSAYPDFRNSADLLNSRVRSWLKAKFTPKR